MCLFSLIWCDQRQGSIVYSYFMDYHLLLTSYIDKVETISINHLAIFIFNVMYTKYQIFKNNLDVITSEIIANSDIICIYWLLESRHEVY